MFYPTEYDPVAKDWARQLCDTRALSKWVDVLMRVFRAQWKCERMNKHAVLHLNMVRHHIARAKESEICAHIRMGVVKMNKTMPFTFLFRWLQEYPFWWRVFVCAYIVRVWKFRTTVQRWDRNWLQKKLENKRQCSQSKRISKQAKIRAKNPSDWMKPK